MTRRVKIINRYQGPRRVARVRSRSTTSAIRENVAEHWWGNQHFTRRGTKPGRTFRFFQ